MEERVIYFVKLGRFSNTNAYFEEQLKNQFPEASLKTIDVKGFFEKPSVALARALMALTASLCLKALRGKSSRGPLRQRMLHELLRLPASFDGMSRYAVQRMKREGEQVWFTIQTQSMWDSSIKGIPHFVYSDSAALTNLYYRGYDFEDLPSPRWLQRERALYMNAEKTLVMSNHVARSLIELYGVDGRKVGRILVGANLRKIPDKPAPAGLDNKTILFVGSNWRRKGGPELVEAFKRLPERHRDARLLIVGESPDVQAANVEIVGRVPSAEVAACYRRSAIFCMPTHIEPFGIVFIEAIMHGVAVASPRHGAMVDYIEDRKTGALFEPGDIDDIAGALTWLLDHPAERRAIAERAFCAVHGVYDWNAVGRRLRTEIAPVPTPKEGS